MYRPARVPGAVQIRSANFNFPRLFVFLRFVEAMTPPEVMRLNHGVSLLPRNACETITSLTRKLFQLTEAVGFLRLRQLYPPGHLTFKRRKA